MNREPKVYARSLKLCTRILHALRPVNPISSVACPPLLGAWPPLLYNAEADASMEPINGEASARVQAATQEWPGTRCCSSYATR